MGGSARRRWLRVRVRAAGSLTTTGRQNERWIATLRAECLDWLLILGPRHLDRVLRIYVQHYNRRRPHRGLALQVPEGLAPVEEADSMPDIERRDLLGGLVHEYMRAA